MNGKRTTRKVAVRTPQEPPILDRMTNRAMIWVGSTTSLFLHTLFFLIIFALVAFGVALDTVLLILTTVVSLEAIYLAIFIQRSVSQQTETLVGGFDELEEAISEDIDETEAALMKDLDETERQLSEDIDEAEAAIISDLDEEVSDPSSEPIATDEMAKVLRKIVREEILKALREK